jgi:predicted RNA binding protein YcfA (HicA-like mRNA interferase family)
MPPLPVLSGDEFAKAAGRLGYSLHHMTGSHMILRNDTGHRLSVPRHRELDRGTLRALIRQAGLTVEEFLELL